MTLRKFHELTPWDERQIFRLQEGRKMRGNHSPEQWQDIFARHRPAPAAPDVTVEVTQDAVLLHPSHASGQLERGAVAAGIGQFRVTNARDHFDPRLPFRLYPLIGMDAFTKANSWRHRYWRVPMEVAREGQRYGNGWDIWRQKIAEGGARHYTVAELANMAISAVGATLTGQDASDFWRANR